MNESFNTVETTSGFDPGPLPPFRFCVAAGLCLVAGLNAIMEMVAMLLLDTFWIDFSFVGIPIGFGILIGRTSSRIFGLIFSALPVFVLTTIILWNFSGGNADLRTILPLEHPAEVAWLVVLLAASIYVFCVLIGPGQPKWKTSPNIDYRPATRLAWMISIIAAVPLLLSHLSQFSIREKSGHLFPIQVTITAYDLESNHHLGRIEVMGDAFSVRQNRSLLSPRLRHTSSPGERGIEALIQGVSYRPVEITIGSEGYRDQVLILDQNTPPDLHLGFERLPPTSLEQMTSPTGDPVTRPIDP
jgi:hypothetical protein